MSKTSNDYEGLEPQFRPGGGQDPKWMEGVRGLISKERSPGIERTTTVAAEIVEDLFAYYDALRILAFNHGLFDPPDDRPVLHYFMPGDVVRMKNTHMRMCVERADPKSRLVECVWFDREDRYNKHNFGHESLISIGILA